MIGQTVYIFDINRRVYPKDDKGRSISGGPIWREHWRPEKIESETSRSWVTEFGNRIPKKNPDPRCVTFSKAEIEEMAWVHEYRYRIVRCLEVCQEPEKVKQVAAILGFKP